MNLVDLQQKIDNYVSVVGSWVRNVGKIYFSSTPENVEVEIIDDSGAIVTKRMPNVAMFRKKVWDDVADGLGQMRQTFYVDASGGDDLNAGDENYPLRTLKKAIESTPPGGRAFIYLKEGQVHTIGADIYLLNSIINISTWHPDTSNPADNATIENVGYIEEGNNTTTGIVNRSGSIFFSNVNLRTAGYVDSSLGIDPGSGLLKGVRETSVSMLASNAIIDISDTDVVRAPYDASSMADISLNNCDIRQVGANRAGKLLAVGRGTASVSDNSSAVTLQDGSGGTVADVIGGQIVRDASTNIPLNFITNFTL